MIHLVKTFLYSIRNYFKRKRYYGDNIEHMESLMFLSMLNDVMDWNKGNELNESARRSYTMELEKRRDEFIRSHHFLTISADANPYTYKNVTFSHKRYVWDRVIDNELVSNIAHVLMDENMDFVTDESGYIIYTE